MTTTALPNTFLIVTTILELPDPIVLGYVQRRASERGRAMSEGSNVFDRAE